MLKVSIYLIGADVLYAAQTKRVVWFGALIAVLYRRCRPRAASPCGEIFVGSFASLN
jgi:hypothetical protein